MKDEEAGRKQLAVCGAGSALRLPTFNFMDLGNIWTLVCEQTLSSRGQSLHFTSCNTNVVVCSKQDIAVIFVGTSTSVSAHL